jgi:hypothetical protein
LAHVQDDQAYEILGPLVEGAIERAPLPRFSTKGLIDFLRSTPEGEAGYQSALATIIDEAGSDHMARMVIHGQVVPGLLRRSGRVRFAGFVHGNPNEDDGYAVPSWWRKV